jgi:methylenetetrahydrofolate reductase (NADPH)
MTPHRGAGFAADISIGMSARDAKRVTPASGLGPGALINIGHLATETAEQRLAATRQVMSARHRPVPHVAARRVPSASALQAVLRGLRAEGANAHLFVVGGDPERPFGPYAGALDVLRSGELERYGVRAVSIAGYPEGHPVLSARTLWSALERKAQLLQDENRAGDVISQLTLDPTAVLAWIADVRERGIRLPIRVGIPGPVRSGTLLGHVRHYAGRVEGTLLRGFGIDAGRPRSIVTADRFVDALAARLDPRIHGEVRLHVFGFGDVAATTQWVGSLAVGFGQADRTPSAASPQVRNTEPPARLRDTASTVAARISTPPVTA